MSRGRRRGGGGLGIPPIGGGLWSGRDIGFILRGETRRLLSNTDLPSP